MDIQYNFTENKNATFFRSIDKLERIPWDKSVQTQLACHWGQRKLFYTELEFLVIASQYMNIDKEECLIVSVGAANGAHASIYKKLFPNTQFLMYDPAKFAIKPDKQFIIKTDNEGFFVDNTVNDVIKIANGRKILYICDIRLETTETSIWENMKQQQLWGIQMGVEMMMLKMRLPYTNENTIGHDFSYSLDGIKDRVVVHDNLKKQWNNVLYLDGDIYIQLHAPIRSTETRLIAGKNKYKFGSTSSIKGDDDKYSLKYYDSVEYEEKLNHFNLHERNMTYSYKESADMVNHLLGFWNNYDTTGEYYLCSEYLTKYKKQKYSHDDTIHMLHEINIFMHNKNITTTRTQIICALTEYRRKIDQYITQLYNIKSPMTKTVFDKSNILRIQVEQIFKKMTELIKVVKASYLKQLEIVNKSTILSDKEKMEQKRIYRNISFSDGRYPIMTITEQDTVIVNTKPLEKILDRVHKASKHFIGTVNQHK